MFLKYSKLWEPHAQKMSLILTEFKAIGYFSRHSAKCLR